jgi:hypothetical protein
MLMPVPDKELIVGGPLKLIEVSGVPPVKLMEAAWAPDPLKKSTVGLLLESAPAWLIETVALGKPGGSPIVPKLIPLFTVIVKALAAFAASASNIIKLQYLRLLILAVSKRQRCWASASPSGIGPCWVGCRIPHTQVSTNFNGTA